jgi:hypothetical protein
MRHRIVITGMAAAACALPLAADAAKPPKAPAGGTPSLTMTIKPVTTTYRGSAVVSGARRGNNRANQPVALQRNPYPFRAFKDVAVTRTDSKGAYRFTIRPTRHTRYRTVTPSPATIYDTVLRSPQVLVHVRLRVGIRLSDSTPRRGQRIRFFGTVAPKHNGRRVYVQRRRSDGRWVTIARTLTRNTTGNRSRYSKRVRIYRTGAYRVRVRGHADHSTGTSRRRAIRVH